MSTEELNAMYRIVRANKKRTEEAYRNEADNALNLNYEYLKSMQRYIDMANEFIRELLKL